MFWGKKTDFYASHLNDYIAQVKNGDSRYLPWIFCVFSENSYKHKKMAANVLSETLNNCSFDDIYRIDRQMRETTSMEWSINWHSLKVEEFVTRQMSEEEKRAVFAFASFNPNGYIREQAIQTLTKYKNVLPFILLRCNDWVYQVRQSALNLLPEILAYASNDEIIYALPLMEKLRRSERCEYNAILPIVVHLFQDNAQLIKQGLSSEDVRARRFCISVLNSLDKTDNDHLMSYISYENDPFLRKIIFQLLLKSSVENIDIIELSKRFLNDKYPPNRILALQYLSDSDDNASDIAIQMLMDKNAQIRSLARSIVLKDEANVDIHQIYLDFLYVQTSISIHGLGEVGFCEDCTLIERFLTDDRVSVVRAAMTALMRLNSEKYISHVTDMLATEQSGIVKTATLLLKKDKGYDYDKILEIQNRSLNENTKIKCATLLFLCSKWKSLVYTLMLIGSNCERLEALCQKQLSRWMFSYNRSYATLSENEKQTIIELLNEKSKFLTPQAVKQIVFLIR